MVDHMVIFCWLCDIFPEVDPRLLKTLALEHHKDVDSATVAVLEEVMPSMKASDGISHIHNEAVPSVPNIVGTLSADHGTRLMGSSSSARHDVRCDEANGRVDSAQCTSSIKAKIGMQENEVGEMDVNPSCQGMNEHLNSTLYHVPKLNDEQLALTKFDGLYFNLYSASNFAHSDNVVGHGQYLSSEYIDQSPMEENGSDSIDLNPAQVQDQDTENTIPAGDCIAQDNSLISDISAFSSKLQSDKKLAHSDDEVGYGGYLPSDQFIESLVAENRNYIVILNITQVQERYSDHIIPVGNFITQGSSLKCLMLSAPVLDFPIPDTGESSAGSVGVLQQKDTNSSDTDYNKHQSGNIAENADTFLSTKSVLLPDLNSNHFTSMASTHLSCSFSIELPEDSIADDINYKNDLLPSLELVTKMIGDVELLEEKAKFAKRKSSVSGTSILTKLEDLKEMLNHAKEANDMHAGEVFGEKSILTTESRELHSRLQRLSDERNSYLAVIEEIRQNLEERLVAAQVIEAADKEKIEKEAYAQARLDEQEKEMNSIVEESIRLQEEAEENLKLKDFLVERGQIVDTLQGEMAMICEDVSELKQIVNKRLSWSKLRRSTISSLPSSLHSSLHRSTSSSDRTPGAVESTDKRTVAEDASPVVEDLNLDWKIVEMLDGCDCIGQDNIKRQDSMDDDWEFV